MHIKRQNKRGISEIVSYVLLILIALTISTIAFGFLKAYVPKNNPECKAGIDIIIENVSCKNEPPLNKLTLVLQNRGLFKIDKAFIRIGNETRKFRADVPRTNPITITNATQYAEGLNPQELTSPLRFDLPEDYSAQGRYILEIQPAYFTKDSDIESLALCPPINQIIVCN